jgi:hypothetical protein
MSNLASLLAQSGGSSNSLSWAIVIFSVLLGLLVALSPSRRTGEIKKLKE